MESNTLLRHSGVETYLYRLATDGQETKGNKKKSLNVSVVWRVTKAAIWNVYGVLCWFCYTMYQL